MNFFIYGISIFIAVALKYIHMYMSLDSLLFILKPVTSLVEIILGAAFVYNPGSGYISEKLSVVIGRECAGINFLIVIFLMLTVSFAAKLGRNKDKLLLTVYFLMVSYIITIIANVSRIVASIVVLRLGITANAKQAILMHQSMGVIFYFIYLLGAYFIFSKLVQQTFKKEWGK